jgi:multiple sugar transport system substrate-binding protein/arabinosaccharide transport system substrate-binding protein
MLKSCIRASALVAVLLLIFALPLVAQEKKDITMWTHDNLYVQFFTDRGKEWAAKYPQYSFKFDFVQIPYGEVFTKVLGNLAAGSGAPDLIGIEISVFSRFMKGGIAEKGLIDLTPLVGGDKDKFVRWEPYSYKGKLYGVESALCPVAYYYRQDIFKDAGIDMPIKTWDDFALVGKKMASQGYAMAPVDSNGNTVFMELFQQWDGLVFDKEGDLTLESPKAVKVLEFLVNGANRDKFFWPTSEYYAAPTFAALKQSKAIGVIMPDWYSVYFLKPNVPEQSGKWRIQNLPVWEAGGRRVSTWGGTGFAITRQSKNPQLVFDLLKYTYLTKENQVRRFKEINYFPHMVDAFFDPGVTQVADPYYGGQNFGGVLAAVAKEIPIQYQSPFWSEAMTEISNQITLAHAAKKTPQQAIKDAAAKIAEIMKKG